jgi:hypothetical protein
MYLEVPGGDTGKADRLLAEHGAERFEGESFSDVPADKVLVCVAENKAGEPGLTMVGFGGKKVTMPQENTFDAVAVAYDEREYAYFNAPDETRTLHWLLVDVEKAIALEPNGDLAQVLQKG